MPERRPVELRARGRTIEGTAMRFGDTAVVIDPRGNQVEERFAAFAFSSYLRSGAATRINLEHDSTLTVASTAGDGRRLGKLVLRDLPDRLDLEARLPEGDVFSEVLSMLPPLGHDLAQTSIEFRSLMERTEHGRRHVLEATLPAVAVVRRGAYPNPVEVRRRSGYRMRATVPKRKRLRCECVGPRCSAVEFESFETGNEVLAVSSTFSKPIASLRKGSLTLNDAGDALRIEIALPDTDAAKEILDASEIAGVLVRPFIDVERSDVHRGRRPAPVPEGVYQGADRRQHRCPRRLDRRRDPGTAEPDSGSSPESAGWCVLWL